MRKIIAVCLCIMLISGFVGYCITTYRHKNEGEFEFGSSFIQTTPSGRFIVSDVIVGRNWLDPTLPDRILKRYIKMNGIPTTLKLLLYDKKSYEDNGEPYKILEYDYQQ